MNAEVKIMAHALAAMDRIFEPKPRVVIEKNPLDRCDVCNAPDVNDSFVHDYQNGRAIALCDDCK